MENRVEYINIIMFAIRRIKSFYNMENSGAFIRAIEVCILAMLREATAGLTDNEVITLSLKLYRVIDTILKENGIDPGDL